MTENSLWRPDGTLYLDAVDPEEFRMVEEGGLVLIHPRKNKFDWTEDERWMRSVVVRKESGEIVSTGWPKFGNDGEFASDSQRLRDALSSGEPVRFTYKEDGSLCVRDVVDGKVMMRTRGTLWGGQRGDDGLPSFGERFADTAMRHYPCLLDPDWCDCGISLLFEYVGPDNQIVVRYDEQDLILLGIIEHGNKVVRNGVARPAIRPWPETLSFAKRHSLNPARTVELPYAIDDIVAAVESRRSEGIVVRCPSGGVASIEDQVLVKLKSSWYLANHRMKHSMNYQRILEFVEANGVKDDEALAELLRAQDFDYEIVQGAKELFAKYIAAQRKADECERKASKLLEDFNKSNSMDDERARRKQLAAMACAQEAPIKGMIFALYDANCGALEKIRSSIVAAGGDQ